MMLAPSLDLGSADFTLCYEGVGYRYSRKSKLVLSQFSWRIPFGRTVLLGPNGAGKSTLLALGASIIRPCQGKIKIGNLNPNKRGERSDYRHAVGWMPQQVHAIPGLSVREQVAYAGWLKGMTSSSAWTTAADVLSVVDLRDRISDPVSQLSGGQLRRIGLAQALVHDPQVLLLDEPTAGLDPAQRSRFRELLLTLPRSRPVVVSTHQVDDLSDLFDHVVVLFDGVIRFRGSVAEFLALAPPGAQRPAEAAYARLAAAT